MFHVKPDAMFHVKRGSMTQNRTSITWPIVAMLGVLAAFVVAVLWVIPKDDTQSRSTMLGILVTASTAITAHFVRNKVGDLQTDVAEVDKKVNGRMTQLIAQTEQARKALEEAYAAGYVSRETSPDVSRETTAPETDPREGRAWKL
jgi:hypothetical protein